MLKFFKITFSFTTLRKTLVNVLLYQSLLRMLQQQHSGASLPSLGVGAVPIFMVIGMSLQELCWFYVIPPLWIHAWMRQSKSVSPRIGKWDLNRDVKFNTMDWVTERAIGEENKNTADVQKEVNTRDGESAP